MPGTVWLEAPDPNPAAELNWPLVADPGFLYEAKNKRRRSVQQARERQKDERRREQ